MAQLFRRHRTIELFRALVLGTLAALLFGIPASVADTYVLQDGMSLDQATVIGGTDEVIYLQTSQGSLLPVMLSDIQRLDLKLVDGDVLSGKLLGFKEGEFRIETDQGIFRVLDGRILGQATREDAVDVLQSKWTLDRESPENRIPARQLLDVDELLKAPM